MEISEADLQARYKQMDTLELLALSKSGALTDIGQQVIGKVIAEGERTRGINEHSVHELSEKHGEICVESTAPRPVSAILSRSVPGPRSCVRATLTGKDATRVEKGDREHNRIN